MNEDKTYIIISFFAFLFLNLIVGWMKGRNVTTLKDYALANRGLGTGSLMVTIIATIIGAKYVTGKIVDSYELGLYSPFIHSIGYVVAALWLGRHVFPKLLRFKGCYTLGDIMNQLYGRKAQIATGVLSALTSVLFIVAQLVAAAVLGEFLGFPKYTVIIIIGIAIMLYTVFGGMRAVSATDMVQFLLVFGGFLFISYHVLKTYAVETTDKEGIKGLKGLFEQVTSKSPTNTIILNHPGWLRSVFAILTSVFTFFSPAIINRVLMGRNEAQVKHSFTGFAIFYPILRLLLTIIGFGLLLSNTPGEVTHTNVLTMIQTKLYSQGSAFVPILLMLMLLAVIMSTADSLLNALVVVILRDIVQPLRKAKQQEIDNVMPWLRGLAVGMGAVSVLFALLFVSQGISPVALVAFAQMSLGIFAFPLILGALGLKGHIKSFFYSVCAFGLASIVLILVVQHYNIFGISAAMWNNPKFTLHRKAYYVTPWALLASGMAFIISHYMVHGKLVWQQLRKRKHDTRPFHTKEKSIFTIFSEPFTWANDKLIRYRGAPELVGIFLTIWHMLPIVTGIDQIMTYYTTPFIIMHGLSLCFCLGLLLEKVWRHPWKKVFPFFYFMALTYCLPFYHLLLFLYEPGMGSTFVQLFFAVMFFHILVDWRTYTLLTIGGMGSALFVYSLTWVEGSKGIDFTTSWELFWGSIFVSLLGFFFLSRQERIYENRVERTKLIAAGFGHDLLNLLNYMRSVEMCRDPKNPKEEDWKAIDEYIKEGGWLTQGFKSMIKHDGILEKDITPWSVEELVEKARRVVGLQYKERVKIVKSKDFKIPVFAPFMNSIIGNLVKNAVVHGSAEEVTISWDIKANAIYVSDNGKGIPDDVAPYVFDLYYSTGDSGVGLSFIKSAMQNMGGDVTFKKNEQHNGVTFILYFDKLAQKDSPKTHMSNGQ